MQIMRIGLMLLLWVSACHAVALDMGVFIGLGYSCCGERLEDSEYVLCRQDSSFCSSPQNEYINAGEGSDLYGGVLAGLDAYPVEFRLAYGLSSYSDTAHDARLKKKHIDGSVYYRFARHRFGGGLGYYYHNQLKRTGGAGYINTYENTLGKYLEYGLQVGASRTASVWFSLRYTNLALKITDSNGGLIVDNPDNIDANNYAFNITFKF